MRFELFLINTLLFACSSGETRYADNYVEVDLGDAPRLNASPLTTSAVASDVVIFSDPSAKAAHRFRIEPLHLERSLALPDTFATGGILVGQEARYVIGLSGADIAVQGEAGYQFNPVTLPGRQVASAAFDPKNHLVALSDDFEAIALIALTPEGGVSGAWIGGPVLGNDGAIGQGGFVGEGQLLASLGAGKFALIDAHASIQAAAWQYKTLDVEGIDQAEFVTALPGDDNLAVIGSSKEMVVLDFQSGSVRTSLPLPEDARTHSSTLGQPHVVYAQVDASVPLKVVYPDGQGTFVERNLKSRVAAGDLSQLNLEQSHLDNARGILTLVVTEMRTLSRQRGTTTVRVVLRYRLADSLLTDVSELPQAGDVALAEDFYLVRYHSSLGFLERRRYGRFPETERLEKFNLPFITR